MCFPFARNAIVEESETAIDFDDCGHAHGSMRPPAGGGIHDHGLNLGAQLMPLNSLVNSMYELDDHKDEEIVLQCRSGARSGMAQGMLQANGFTNVRNLTGGILAWEAAFGKTRV